MIARSPRRTVARHGRLRAPRAWSQALRLVALSLAVVLVSGTGVAAYVVYDLSATVSSHAVALDGEASIPPDISAYKDGFNLLLTGLDKCEPAYASLFPGRCDGPDADGISNDVTLMVHVSTSPRRVTVVSFPRDMIVPVPSCTAADGSTIPKSSGQMFNTTYKEGGLNCVARTITALTDQPVQFAASVTFGGVIEITNAIGGVDVCLATPLQDPYTGLDLSAGTHTIAGYEALQFLRTRHGLVSGSDLARIGNQQQYMSSLARKLVSGKVLGDVPTLLKLATVAVKNLEASTSLANPATLVQLALAVKDVPLSDITFVQYPNVTDPDNPNRVLPDEDAAKALWDAIVANAPLEITHQNTENDGVTVEPAPGSTTAPVDPAAPATQDATPAPDPAPTSTAVPLPQNVKGNTASQATCSNGTSY